jgi:hypothetical protein
MLSSVALVHGRTIPTERPPCHVVNVTDPYGRNLDFLDAATFLSCSSSTVLTRLSGLRSTPTTSQKNIAAQGIEPGPLDL